MNSEVCVLDDGQRVRFSLKKRERDPFYLACFRGPDGRKKELSTKEANKRRAIDTGVVLVRAAFTPKREATKNPSWDEAVEAMTRQMEANNLRPKTIEQYVIAVNHLRSAFPETGGPGGITPAMVSRFKAIRIRAGVKPRTVQGSLENLGIVYKKWLLKECSLLNHNPFEGVSLPKADKQKPRFVTDAEARDFLDWLERRWRGWRLPRLFLQVKALIGCRITELAAARPGDLKDGRITFIAQTNKGRKERAAILPDPVFEELKALAGTAYIFEGFSEQLRRIYLDRGRPHHAGRIKGYSPERLKDWLENEAQHFFKVHPQRLRFKLHNLRGAAMTRAWMAGIKVEDAAIAFGCDPETMRQHYLALDEQAIADRVLRQLNGASQPVSEAIEGRAGRPATLEGSDSRHGEKAGR
jgi:integrase